MTMKSRLDALEKAAANDARRDGWAEEAAARDAESAAVDWGAATAALLAEEGDRPAMISLMDAPTREAVEHLSPVAIRALVLSIQDRDAQAEAE